MKIKHLRTCTEATRGRRRSNGFSLIELMITLVVLALLVSLAYPSYTRWVRKAHRGDAQKLLLNWANNQEIWRSNHPSYADDVASPNGIPVPVHERYTFSLGAPNPPTASQYVLVATATGIQAKDGETSEGQCAVLTLNQLGARTPAACWD